jgi:hypothetical protein
MTRARDRTGIVFDKRVWEIENESMANEIKIFETMRIRTERFY